MNSLCRFHLRNFGVVTHSQCLLQLGLASLKNEFPLSNNQLFIPRKFQTKRNTQIRNHKESTERKFMDTIKSYYYIYLSLWNICSVVIMFSDDTETQMMEQSFTFWQQQSVAQDLVEHSRSTFKLILKYFIRWTLSITKNKNVLFLLYFL